MIAYGIEREGNTYKLIQIEHKVVKKKPVFETKLVYVGEKVICLGMLRTKLFYDYKDL